MKVGSFVAGALGLGGALAAASFLEARAGYVLRHIDVPLLAPGQKDIRVLHISDLHLRPNNRCELAFISRLANTRPDLVIGTGDFISSHDAIYPMLQALGDLLDRPGVFVFGSNDRYRPRFKNPLGYLFANSKPLSKPLEQLPWQHLRDALTMRGWHDLNNKKTIIEVAGRQIELRGTGDAHYDQDRYELVAGASSEADLSFGVTHAPYQRVLNAFALDGLDMAFAGHTHGGQICLPVNRAIITNCDLPRKMASGFNYWRAQGSEIALHVSAGLGTSPYAPFRLFCRPEATLIRLTSKA